MGYTPFQIQQYIRQARCYRPNLEHRLVNDIHETSSRYPSISIFVATHVNDEGVRQELVCLGGTIPIVFCDVSYNLPLRIWIMTYYPSGPPVVLLQPNESMLIDKRHKNVDSNGKVYMPELTTWDPYRSSLCRVVARMVEIFSQKPPLYKRRAAARPPSLQPSAFRPASSRDSQPSHDLQQTYPVKSRQSGTVDSEQSGPVETPSPRSAISMEHERQLLVQAFSERAREYLAVITESALAESSALMNELDEIRNCQETLEDARRQQLAAKKSHDDKMMAVIVEHDTLRARMAEANVDEGDLSVEKVIMTDPYTWQVVDCVARDAAHRDALDAVSDALADSAVDMGTFMKETKRLSRELFALRALKLKIRRMQAKLRPEQDMSALLMSASQV